MSTDDDVKYMAALRELSNEKTITMLISEQAAFSLICQIQLAFRHPANTGASKNATMQCIQPLVEYFSEDVRELLEKGFHPEFDEPLTENRKKETQFLMDKEHYIVNNLSLGIAVKYLCQATRQTYSYWVRIIADEANNQCDQLTPEQIEQAVQAYLLGETND